MFLSLSLSLSFSFFFVFCVFSSSKLDFYSLAFFFFLSLSFLFFGLESSSLNISLKTHIEFICLSKASDISFSLSVEIYLFDLSIELIQAICVFFQKKSWKMKEIYVINLVAWCDGKARWVRSRTSFFLFFLFFFKKKTVLKVELVL